MEQKVYLHWTTFSEVNNDHFEIEKSSNGSDFITAGIVKGAGNSNVILMYNFTDESPYHGKNFYRLKQVDADGKFSYSNIIFIDNQQTITSSIYPNPADENISLKIMAADGGNGTISIVNVLGETLLSGELLLQPGENIFTISASALPSSFYFVNISYENKNEVHKLIRK
ncbi:MAG: T9SS type A sorting domain-containing protein [Cytophagaceae bacterium]|nr:T9SS type A sorting domain-containing protein [Cytophagaceae bacterium]